MASAARKQDPAEIALLERFARLPKGRPWTEEERRLIDEARNSGPCIPHEQVMAELAARCDDEDDE